jgi:hypothetical protein
MDGDRVPGPQDAGTARSACTEVHGPPWPGFHRRDADGAALAGRGESAQQKKHKAVEIAEKQSSLETKASLKSALPEARHALAQIEHNDTLARFQARRAKRPAPAGHTNEIERLRGWIRYAEAEVSHE